MGGAKPPLPSHEGLLGKPTIINNVLTLAAVPWIMANGAIDGDDTDPDCE